MARPRYKQYTDLARKKRKPRSYTANPGQASKVLVTIFLILIICGVGYYALANLPMSSSLSGDYVNPSSISDIEQYSQARWYLHSAHVDLLTVCISWFENSSISSSTEQVTIDSMEAAGFMPFMFKAPDGSLVNVTEGNSNTSSMPENFIIDITHTPGNNPKLTVRKVFESKSVLGKKFLETEDKVEDIDPGREISVIAQFQPNHPEFTEEYVGFLAHLWNTALEGFIRIYNRPPNSLNDVLNGLGLEFNPDCYWPFYNEEEEEDYEFNADVEGGLVDGKIIYWLVTYENGSKGGQARYWDMYTTYDDPETPQSIIAGSSNSQVVNPELLTGAFNPMFSMAIYRERLMAVKPQPEPVEEE